MKRILFLLLVFCANAAFSQKQIVYNSKYLSKPDTVWVFSPKKSDSKLRYPVVYLLHGYSGNYKQWHSIMDAQKYADEFGYILVCPDGLFNSWYFNSPAKADSQFESFFYKDLLPDIDKKFNTDTTKRFITGLSMGGHGALSFLKHPEMFVSAGSTSGVVDLRSSTVKYGIADLLGKIPDDSPVWLQYSVIGNLEKLAGSKKQIIFDCGVDDPFYKVNKALRERCDSLKIPATFIAQPGRHDRNYWAKSIRQHFSFFQILLN